MKKAWEIHIFHAVLEMWMIRKGLHLAEELKLDFSEFCNVLFALCRGRIFLRHCTERDQESHYETLEKSKDKNICLTEKNYQQLKKMHHDLNYFSMSQILRKIMEDFFNLVDELGLKEAISYLEEEAKQIRKKGLFKGNMAKLLATSMQLHMTKGHLAVYDKGFKLQSLYFKLAEG